MNALMLGTGFVLGGIAGHSYARRYPNETLRQMVTFWIVFATVAIGGSALLYVLPLVF